jgi:hypothetical protein
MPTCTPGRKKIISVCVCVCVCVWVGGWVGGWEVGSMAIGTLGRSNRCKNYLLILRGDGSLTVGVGFFADTPT